MKYLSTETEDLQIDMGQNVDPFFRAFFFFDGSSGKSSRIAEDIQNVFVGEVISGMLNLPFTMMVLILVCLGDLTWRTITIYHH